jgi:hypothetical protein
VSIFTAVQGEEPCVEQSFSVKFVGVSGSSNDEERIEVSAPSRPTISRESGNSQLMMSTGPKPTDRLIGPASPSKSISKPV